MTNTAVVVGATGLTGSILTQLLFNEERYDAVITLSRKRNSHNNPKHENHIVDLWQPASYAQFLGDVHLYICTGTTQAKTPDKADYYRIEHDLPLTVAQAACDSGTDTIVTISALDAHPDSTFLYTRGKGKMEKDIAALGFKNCYFVRPALIGGDREEHRPFEKYWKKFQRLVDPLMAGWLEKYRIIEPETIAQSMIYLAHNGYKNQAVDNATLKELAKKYVHNN